MAFLSRLRTNPVDTILSVLAALLIFAMIAVGGIGSLVGLKNVIGGMR
jgi:hypothetical protein